MTVALRGFGADWNRSCVFLFQVETMKKAYHSACKEEKLATSRENSSKLESNVNPEAQKKLQDKVEKCQQEMQKTKERYEKSLEELDKCTPQYMENMEQVFEQWQQFEDKRIRFFKDLLLEVKKHLDLSTNHKYETPNIKLNPLPSTGPQLRTVYQTLEDTIEAADADDDLKWFRSNHGPGMPMNWPQFEVLSIPMGRGRSIVPVLSLLKPAWQSAESSCSRSRKRSAPPTPDSTLAPPSASGSGPSEPDVEQEREEEGWRWSHSDGDKPDRRASGQEQKQVTPHLPSPWNLTHSPGLLLALPSSTEQVGSNPFEDDEDEEELPAEEPNSTAFLHSSSSPPFLRIPLSPPFLSSLHSFLLIVSGG
ncbi:hypothetical protein JZ751_022202 [Albula glossodonta]|uniref:F-BAR domain-containing protein n=1 Tax=Albula glossodonta TaxID=121402 RepID=A0A8T2NI01_9TELE|nr:hypothetical protein JZ751_022202 [Albula glossodonta]